MLAELPVKSGLRSYGGLLLQKDINGVKLPALKAKYDIIFQLCHLYRHLIDEGVGLSQVLDYYYLLKSEERRVKSEVVDGVASLAEESSTAIQHTLKHLGLLRFASALMWVMQEVFDLPEKSMICKTSEKEGKFLLEEIMLAGNFGQGDSRMVQLQFKKGEYIISGKTSIASHKAQFPLYSILSLGSDLGTYSPYRALSLAQISFVESLNMAGAAAISRK